MASKNNIVPLKPPSGVEQWRNTFSFTWAFLYLRNMSALSSLVSHFIDLHCSVTFSWNSSLWHSEFFWLTTVLKRIIFIVSLIINSVLACFRTVRRFHDANNFIGQPAAHLLSLPETGAVGAPSLPALTAQQLTNFIVFFFFLNMFLFRLLCQQPNQSWGGHGYHFV